MATEAKFINELKGVNSRLVSRVNSALVVAGNTTVKGPITVPPGSYLTNVDIETPTAITGTPTSCLVSVGTTDGGVDIVAAVDCKTQAHVAATIVAAFDKILGLATLNTLYIQVVTTGGTASAGTINVNVQYAAPQAF
jgi:hypothetical protein